jgi:hypothetical protein
MQEVIIDLVKTVGAPFALVFFLIFKADRYVARMLNHQGEMNQVLKEIRDEVKCLKYYLHAQKPPKE